MNRDNQAKLYFPSRRDFATPPPLGDSFTRRTHQDRTSFDFFRKFHTGSMPTICRICQDAKSWDKFMRNQTLKYLA
jgi:hypothetical protein